MNIYSNITKNLKENERANIEEVLNSNINSVIEALELSKYRLVKEDNWYHQLDNTSLVFNYENLIADFDILLNRVKEFQESFGGGDTNEDNN